MNDFYGYPVRRLTSKYVELDCLATAGPRIVRLKYKGSNNLLAEVPEISIPTPYGDYHYLGGHRLWHSPESMPRSYIPDGEGMVASELPDGLALDGRREPGTGIHKRVEVRLHSDEPKVTLSQTLINEGLWDVKLSPWALTMFRLGGTAILPIRADESAAEDLLPNRHFSLWPYSQLNDPRLQLENEFILIRAKPDLPPFKIGTFNPRGWTAYWLGDVLFRKTFAVHPGLRHPDYDCNAEIYCDSHFIELESLGPLSRLAPGDFVTLNETWEFYDSLEQSFLSEKMIELITKDVK
jgi:hypothetical protein